MAQEVSQRDEDGAAPATIGVERGTVLASKYRVEAVLGSGGMGVVFAATHLQLGEPFAVKLLHKEASARLDSISRFLQEARIAMRLRGEHVVRVYEVGTLEDGSPFIAMELLEGRDLRVVLSDDGRIAPKLAVDYALQACEAIAEAHALGFIHRDLKPANLFLTRRLDGSPCVKVLDFGVSKIAAASAVRFAASVPEEPEPALFSELAETVRSPGITRTHALLGSPRYMAPEQLRSARDVDLRADIWALGAILFELLSGEPPFGGESLDAVRRTVLEEPAPPLAGVPGELEWIVHRCLAKDPRQRFGTVGDLAQALAPFASEEGGRVVDRIARLPRGPRSDGAAKGAEPSPSADPATVSEAVAAGAAPRRSTRKAPAIAVVVMVGAALLLMIRRPPPPPVASEARHTAAAEPPAAVPTAPLASGAVAAALHVDPPSTSSVTPAHAPARRARPSAPTSTASTGAAPTSLPASPALSAAPAAPDPLWIDAGALFDQRK